MFKRLKSEIQVIKEKDPAMRSTIEVFFCYPGFYAIIFHRKEVFMTDKNLRQFTVLKNDLLQENKLDKEIKNESYHSNPMYEKLLNFRNLQEQQKKRFSVEDLLKW